MAKPRIFIGTSGWMYKHWNGLFYPDDVTGTDQLKYFAKHFDTVEINNTFYRIPYTKAAEGWRDHTPRNFIFAVKLNNYLTHNKRLIWDEQSEERLKIFLKAIKPINEKTRALLVQLPPSFKANFERLDIFLMELNKRLPTDQDVCCEFRHDSWFTDELNQVLEKHKAGFVIATYPGQKKSDYPITAGAVYIRYHAWPERPNYPDKQLDEWTDYIKSLPGKVKNIYIYFNNDFEGCAVQNADYLKKTLKV